MFYKKTINDLYNKIKGNSEWNKKKYSEYENAQKWTIEEIKKIQNFEKMIKNAIPGYNKTVEKIKQLEELSANLLILAQKMDEKIKKLEQKITTKPTNKRK